MASERTIRVVLVEDHELFRKGLRDLLGDEAGIDVVGEATDGQSASAVVAELVPDVVVMDVNLPERSGIETTRAVRRHSPTSRVLMLSVSEDADDIAEAIVAGACGYVLKDSAVEDIADGVRAAAGGEPKLSARIAARLLELIEGEAPAGGRAGEARLFSEREREILRLIATGADHAGIAADLDLSPAAVDNHVANALAKLEARARAERYSRDARPA